MSVIVELQVPAADFALGQIFQAGGRGRVELETMVPAGERTVPLFWVYGEESATFEQSVARHEAVEAVREVDAFEDRRLYALDWQSEQDHLLTAIRALDAQLLSGEGVPVEAGEHWELEVRFPDHAALSAFQQRCERADIDVRIGRLYNPSRPDGQTDYGLTEPQREALVLAVTKGYYDIPREATTLDLADALDVSDQAVTERLRRAIVSLVGNTLLVSED